MHFPLPSAHSTGDEPTLFSLFSLFHPYDTETVWTTKKLSGQSRNYPDTLKTVWIIQKLSGQPENYLDSQQTVPTIQNLSGQSGNCPDSKKNCPENLSDLETVDCQDNSEYIQIICNAQQNGLKSSIYHFHFRWIFPSFGRVRVE